jgi:hypothetical protein
VITNLQQEDDLKEVINKIQEDDVTENVNDLGKGLRNYFHLSII